MVGANGIRGRLGVSGWRFDVAKGTLDSALCTLNSVSASVSCGDAGPYLARMVFAGGWGLAVGGLLMRHQVPSMQHSIQDSVL